MKIAVSTDKDMVSEHFGRCPEYTIAVIEDERILSKQVFPNPGHSTGSIPNWLNEKGVEVVIAGGMGPRAVGFFNEFGIRPIVGISGKVDTVLEKFIEGKLESGNSTCSPQAGRGYGLDKEDGHH